MGNHVDRELNAWHSLEVERETSKIHYRFEDMTIKGLKELAWHGSVVACVEDQKGEMFKPAEERRGIHRVCQAYEKYLKPKEDEPLSASSFLRRKGGDVVELKFNVSGRGHASIHMGGEDAYKVSFQMDAWGGCEVSMQVTGQNNTLLSRKSTVLSSCSSNWTLSLHEPHWFRLLPVDTAQVVALESPSDAIWGRSPQLLTYSGAVGSSWDFYSEHSHQRFGRFPLLANPGSKTRVVKAAELLPSSGGITNLSFRLEGQQPSSASIFFCSDENVSRCDVEVKFRREWDQCPWGFGTSQKYSQSCSWGRSVEVCFVDFDFPHMEPAAKQIYCESVNNKLVTLSVTEGSMTISSEVTLVTHQAHNTTLAKPRSFFVKTAEQTTWRFQTETGDLSIVSPRSRKLDFPEGSPLQREGSATIVVFRLESIGNEIFTVELADANACRYAFSISTDVQGSRTCQVAVWLECNGVRASQQGTDNCFLAHDGSLPLWLRVDPQNRVAALGRGTEPGTGQILQFQRWPGTPENINFQRSADVVVEFLATYKECGGDLPDTWDGDDSAELGNRALRVSFTGLEGLMWTRIQKGVHQTSNYAHQYLDAQLTQTIDVADPRVAVNSTSTANFWFHMHKSNFTWTCSNANGSKVRYPPLFSAGAGRLTGLGAVSVMRTQSRTLNVSVLFDDRAAVLQQNLHMSHVTLDFPKLPMKRAALEEFVQDHVSRLIPGINKYLELMPFVIPADVARFVPCRDTHCTVKLGRVRATPTNASVTDIGYLEFSDKLVTKSPGLGNNASHGFVHKKHLRSGVLDRQKNSASFIPHRFHRICKWSCNKTDLAWCRQQAQNLSRQAIELAKRRKLQNNSTLVWVIALVIAVVFLGALYTLVKLAIRFAWWMWSSVDATCLVAMLLFWLSMVWRYNSPYANFTSESLLHVGMPGDFNIDDTVAEFQSWTCIGSFITLMQALLTFFWGVYVSIRGQPSSLRADDVSSDAAPMSGGQPAGPRADDESSDAASMSEDEASCSIYKSWIYPCIVYVHSQFPSINSSRIYLCIVAVLSQFLILIAMPMSTHIGSILTGEQCSDAGGDCTSTMLTLFAHAAGLKTTTALSYRAASFKGMFTGAFVAYMGIYFMFFLLAIPFGTNSGAFLWGIFHGRGSEQHGAMDMAMVLAVLSNVAISAAVLGPFVIVYQILGGNPMWWVALAVPCLFGPLCLLPVRAIVNSSSSWLLAMTYLGLLYAVISCLAAVFLWWELSEALAAVGGILNVNGWFTCSLFGCVASFVAIGTSMCFNMKACNSEEFFEKIVVVVQPLICLDAAGVLGFMWGWLLYFGSTQVTSWIWWLLSMDALVTFYFHLAKVFWLGWFTGCFQQWACTAPAISHRLLRGDEAMTKYLSQCRGEMAREEDVQWNWSVAAGIFGVSIAAALMTSNIYERLSEPDHFYERCAECMRFCRRRYADCMETLCRRGRQRTEESEQRALYASVPSEQTRHQEADEDIGGDDRAEIDTMSQAVRRIEFILVGLAHWLCVVLRQKIWKQGMPHNFDAALIRFNGTALNNETLRDFHDMLQQQWHLKLPTGGVTMFDKAFMKLDLFFAMSLSTETWALIFLVLAAYFRFKGFKLHSICSVVCVGVLGLIASLLPFLPNYVAVLELEEYYTGCAPKFDAFISLILRIIFGSGFSALLGWLVFAHLFSLPISLVRGLWLLLLKPPDEEETQDKHPAVLGILSSVMRFQACIIPLITIFPLLFAFQIVEDNTSWRYLLGFWLVPQVWILAQRSSGEKVNENTVFAYRSIHFYTIWLLAYIGSFAFFLHRQFEIFNASVLDYIRDMDWPMAWSWMHVDFCVMNVVITDVIGMIIKDNRGPAPVGSPTEEAARFVDAGRVDPHRCCVVIDAGETKNGAKRAHLLLEYDQTASLQQAVAQPGIRRLQSITEQFKMKA